MIHASLQRGIAAGILSAVFVIGTGPAALAQAQRSTGQKPTRAPSAKAAPEKPAQAATGPGGASLVTSYGDWGVYTAQAGRTKICYALSQPQDRLPKDLNRDPAYLFVSFRPAENVKNEVALVLGFPTKENGPAEAAIGSASYPLITKAENAWLKDPDQQGEAITAMMRGQNMAVKTQSARGNSLTDLYSLTGFTKAVEHARKECS